MLDKPRTLSLFPNSLINSIKHEHSCKILYICICLDFCLILKEKLRPYHVAEANKIEKDLR